MIVSELVSDLVTPLITPLTGIEGGDSTPSLLLENGFFLFLEDGTQLYLE
jgi:hypothetical protein